MKRVVKSILTVIICVSLIQVYGQSFGQKGTPKTRSAPGASVAINLKNLSNDRVTIYAGPKEELSTPNARQKIYEGQSTYTIYASVNEVVCIIGPDEKPVSCVDIMTGTEALQIDNTGTSISTGE